MEVSLGFTFGKNKPVDCDDGSGATLFPLLGVAFDWVPDVNGRGVAIFRGAMLTRGESGATANNDDSDESGGDDENGVFSLRGESVSPRLSPGGETSDEPDDDCDDNLIGGNDAN